MSDEEELRPAFETAAWSNANKGKDEEGEFELVPEEDGPLSFQLSREGDTIVGRILNSGETIVLSSRPAVGFSFSPAELLKFDMPASGEEVFCLCCSLS
jgi:hypothetical protein